MVLGKPSQEDESHNTYSLFGGPDRLEPLRAIKMGNHNGECSQTLDSDISFSSEMEEEDTAPESGQQDPWCPARNFSEQGTSWLPEVHPQPKKLPRFGRFIYEPVLKLSAWSPEEKASWMRSNPPGLVVCSRQANGFCHQGEDQHTAATAAGPVHCSIGPASPEPWVPPNLPGDFFSFLLEAEDQVADNPAEPLERTPWIGTPRSWDCGFFNRGRRPPPGFRPELLPLSPFLGLDSESPSLPSSSFRPPVFRAWRRRLSF